MDPHAVIAEARTWLGTPFHHQASLKGVGCDCAGLIRGVGHACGILPGYRERWRRHGNYGRLPNPRRMEAALRAFMREVPKEQMRLADVLWMQWRRDLPMHLGIVAERDGRQTLIHALSDIGRVVEHGLTVEWRARIHSVWRYPGLMDAEVPDGA